MNTENENRWYYEDLEPGQCWLSPRRTVTEADVVNFAGLSGDYNALHTDEVYASAHKFGRRAAHGLLTLCMASGLVTRMPAYQRMDGARIALTELRCRWKRPVFIGDTIQVRLTIGAKSSSTRPETGLVMLEREVLNQEGQVVVESEWQTLIKRREAS